MKMLLELLALSHQTKDREYTHFNIYVMSDYQTLLRSLNYQSYRENVLSVKYTDLYNEILNFNKNHEGISFRQKVFNYMNNIIEIPKCKICDKNVNFYNNAYSIYCSNKCQNSDVDLIKKSNGKRLKTMQSKYDVNYTFDMQSTKDKIKKTLRDKYY